MTWWYRLSILTVFSRESVFMPTELIIALLTSFPVLISHLLFCAGLCTSNIKFRFQIGLCPLLCQSSCVYNCRFNDRFDDRRIRLNLLTNLINRYAQNDCYYNSLNCSQTYTDCNCCRRYNQLANFCNTQTDCIETDRFAHGMRHRH